MIDFRKELADFNFIEKYSMLKEDGTRETWDESIDRIWDMHEKHLTDKGWYKQDIKKLANECRKMEKSKLFLSAQRARQWGGVGRGILDKNERILNCAGSYADRQEFFGQFIYLLLCGCGAGYNMCKKHVDKLPIIKDSVTYDGEYFVEDTIEGWAKVVDVVMDAFMNTGILPDIKYDKIRPKGSLISGRFIHGGYEPLKESIDNVIRIVDNAMGRKLKPIEVFDICCYLSQAVLSGGVRRSATIALFSWDDAEMFKSKTGDWFNENPQRAMANISPIMVRKKVKKRDVKKVVDSCKIFGEPGVVFAENEDFVTNPLA